MKFRVVWLRPALEQANRDYNRLFETGRDAQSITRAMAQIDLLLGKDPHSQGESRSEGERILTEAPLTVQYEIHDDVHVVVVWRVVYRHRKT